MELYCGRNLSLLSSPMPVTAKETAIEIIRRLSDEATPEEIVAEHYFRQKVEIGLEDVEKHRTLTHDEAKERLAKWLS